MALNDQLIQLCNLLVDLRPGHARVLIEAQRPESGYWFGGGNMVRAANGHLYLVGRYRNAGDSRTGVAAGTRGLELAVFCSRDQGRTFQKVLSWDKAALDSPSGKVLSIEGSCLRLTPQGAELYVSTEKVDVSYPQRVSEFLKPGAGIWMIDVLRANTIEELQTAEVCAAFRSEDPLNLHVKDPFVWSFETGDRLGFCSHPFNWTSSNTGVVDFPELGSSVAEPEYCVIARGPAWDVAITRGTSVLRLPSVGICRDQRINLLFYCGGECVRSLDEHATSVRRPRGYSCEELGGVLSYRGDDLSTADRLSDILPLFVSPTGTGCCRYVDVLEVPEGYFVTWQQSQPDLSQPLMLNYVAREQVEAILSQT